MSVVNTASRERVVAALQHKEPDKIPIDLGATRFSGIHIKAYVDLRNYLSLSMNPPKIFDVWQQLALPGEELLSLFEVDVAGFYRKRVSLGFSNEEWKGHQLDDGSEVLVSLDYDPVLMSNGDRAIVIGGKTIAVMPSSGYYYDLVDAPLRKARTASDVDSYPWDRIDDQEMDYLKKESDSCFATGKAVVANYCGSVLTAALVLRGYEQFYVEILDNRPFA